MGHYTSFLMRNKRRIKTYVLSRVHRIQKNKVENLKMISLILKILQFQESICRLKSMIKPRDFFVKLKVTSQKKGEVEKL